MNPHLAPSVPPPSTTGDTRRGVQSRGDATSDRSLVPVTCVQRSMMRTSRQRTGGLSAEYPEVAHERLAPSMIASTVLIASWSSSLRSGGHRLSRTPPLRPGV